MTASSIFERRTRTAREVGLVDRLRRRSNRIRRERELRRRHLPWAGTDGPSGYRARFLELDSAWRLPHLRAEVRKIQAELAVLRKERPDPLHAAKRMMAQTFAMELGRSLFGRVFGKLFAPERE